MNFRLSTLASSIYKVGGWEHRFCMVQQMREHTSLYQGNSIDIGHVKLMYSMTVNVTMDGDSNEYVYSLGMSC